MYKFLTKNGQLVAIAIGLISAIGAIGSIMYGVTSKYSMSEDLILILKDKDSTETFDFFNPAIQIVAFLLLIALLAAILFGVFSLVTDPKGAVKFLIGFGLMLGLFFILYSTSQVGDSPKMVELMDRFDVSDNVSKLISGGVKTVVISIVLAAVSAAVLEVVNLFK